MQTDDAATSGTSNDDQFLDQLNPIKSKIAASHCDIIAITETFLQPEIPDAHLQVPDYNLYRLDRVSRDGGGVALYVRDYQLQYCSNPILCTTIHLNSSFPK